ncbi:MAG: hypothetical protein A2632_00990 [Candidatus Pacebacteria bacterium RIFCSPHIGHO2_01_FULL_46_16]|nr:MAG: hypothetical protein A2632_00990 [Candidatus Pacebacteria bacterium RIFCSPHIGHO2_01_FULL_46_16]
MRKIQLYFYYGVLGLTLMSQVLVTLVTESVWVKGNTAFNSKISTQDMLLAHKKRLENELAQISSLTDLELEAQVLGYQPIKSTVVVSNQTKLADSMPTHP